MPFLVVLVPVQSHAQLRISLDDSRPLDLSGYRYIATGTLDSLQLKVTLRSASGATYSYASPLFTAKAGTHRLPINTWQEADSLLEPKHRALHERFHVAFPEHTYTGKASVLTSRGSTLHTQDFTFRPGEMPFAIEHRDSLLVFRGLPAGEAVVLGHQRGRWKRLQMLGDSAVVIEGVDSVAVEYKGTTLRKHFAGRNPVPSPDLSRSRIVPSVPFTMLPIPRFGLDRVSYVAGASFSERPFPGTALQTPYYHATLTAEGNVLGLPLKGGFYGMWLRGSQPDEWSKSPLNYVLLEFDKERFDRQYALDLSDERIREAIEHRRRKATASRIAIDNQLSGLDAKPGIDTMNALPGQPDTSVHLPAPPDTAGWSKKREKLLEKRREVEERTKKYDRLLRQIDSLDRENKPLQISDIDPSLRREFATSGLIRDRMRRLQTLEIGDVYPRRYTGETSFGYNEFRGISTEFDLVGNLSFYGLLGNSRFSLVGGALQTRLAEAGLVQELGPGKLSVIASRESMVRQAQEQVADLASTPLPSAGNTYLILGYEHSFGKRLSAGVSAEQKTQSLSRLDSLNFDGRYYGHLSFDATVARLKGFAEYTDHAFARNIYLNTINGSVRTGVEAHIPLFSSTLQTMVGYEMLVQPGQDSEAYSSELRNSGYKFSVSTHFVRYPNISLGYYPYQTQGRSTVAAGGTLMSFSSRSSLAQGALTYGVTGGRLKYQFMLQGQRVTNALTYDLQSAETRLNSSVDIATAVVSAYSKKHVASLNCNVQRLDTAEYQTAFAQYEYILKPVSLGAKIGAGRSASAFSFQAAALVKVRLLGVQLQLEPGLQRFRGAKSLHPFINIALSGDLWNRQ